MKTLVIILDSLVVPCQFVNLLRPIFRFVINFSSTFPTFPAANESLCELMAEAYDKARELAKGGFTSDKDQIGWSVYQNLTTMWMVQNTNRTDKGYDRDK